MKRVREDGQADDHGWTEDYESAMKTLDNLADQAQTELSGMLIRVLRSHFKVKLRLTRYARARPPNSRYIN